MTSSLCKICNSAVVNEEYADCGAILCRECLTACRDLQGDCMACTALDC